MGWRDVCRAFEMETARDNPDFRTTSHVFRERPGVRDRRAGAKPGKSNRNELLLAAQVNAMTGCANPVPPESYFFPFSISAALIICSGSGLFSMHSYSSTRTSMGVRKVAPVAYGFANITGSSTRASQLRLPSLFSV